MGEPKPMRHAGDTRARLYVEGSLDAGGEVPLAAGQAHYLLRVLRLEPGTLVAAFNARDGEWRCRIVAAGRGQASLAVADRLRAPTAEADLWLAFAPVKKARLDMLVEKATELGIARLMPVMTRNTDAARVNVDRLRAQVVEASEQCERLTVPAVADTVPLPQLLSEWPDGRPLLVADETGGGRPLAEVLRGFAHGASGGVLVGPPGGFAAAELDEMRKLPFAVFVGLGPRILRAETAALSAIAVWQALIGDWQGHASGRVRD